MNKNILLAVLFAAVALAGCDYNDRNFNIDDDANNIKNVTSYNDTLPSKYYPAAGYFTTDSQIKDSVNKYLLQTYLTCDSGSTAKVSLTCTDTTVVSDPAIADTLKTADYTAMGTDKGYPGKYNNFDATMDIDFYLTKYLKNKYPYAISGVVKKVAYTYYGYANSSATKKTTFTTSHTYTYNGSIWNSIYTKMTKIANMAYKGRSNGWTLNVVTGGEMDVTLSNSDYVLLYNWVAANKPTYLSTQYPTNTEYYFGASSYYNEIDYSQASWIKYCTGQDYSKLTSDALTALIDSRVSEGLRHVVLPAHVTKYKAGVSYKVTYYKYLSKGANYAMTFMYSASGDSLYLYSGPTAE